MCWVRGLPLLRPAAFEKLSQVLMATMTAAERRLANILQKNYNLCHCLVTWFFGQLQLSRFFNVLMTAIKVDNEVQLKTKMIGLHVQFDNAKEKSSKSNFG